MRMGEEKATLKTKRGVDFFEHAARRLGPMCECVVLSVAAEQTLPTSREFIRDPATSFGPISGIERALSYAFDHNFDECVFTPVDTPRLSEDHVISLIDEGRRHGSVACAVASPSSDRLEPLISYIPVVFLDVFREAIQAGHYSLQKVFRRFDRLRLVEFPGESCANLNAPEDFRSYLLTDEHSTQ